jgi:large subunit ribosomal protein L30e
MDTAKTIKDAVKDERLVIGSRTVLKGVKNKTLDSVICASNCPDSLTNDLNQYSRVSGIKLEQFSGNSVQLGELCGKPFKILIIGVKKSR